MNMNTKQAKTVPVGMVVSRGRAGHELERGTVLANRPKTDSGFLVRWHDGLECWIDYRGAKNIFVAGLRGTRKP
jgi:hypothetical protein